METVPRTTTPRYLSRGSKQAYAPWRSTVACFASQSLMQRGTLTSEIAGATPGTLMRPSTARVISPSLASMGGGLGGAHDADPDPVAVSGDS